MRKNSDNRIFSARNLAPFWSFFGDSRLKTQDSRLILVIFALALAILAVRPATAGATSEEKRAKIRTMANDTLQSLYRMEPRAQSAVEKSAGYAVFDNTGVHVLLPTTTRGGGIAVNSQSKEETFMRMRSAGARQGMGAEDCRMVFVFETRNGFDQFVNSGWDGSNWADTTAGLSSKDGAYSGAFAVERGIWVYEIVERGLAFQLSLEGTKYRRDDKLNKQ